MISAMKLVARWVQVAASEVRICQVRAPFGVLLPQVADLAYGEPHGEILGAHIIGLEATELILHMKQSPALPDIRLALDKAQ